MKIKVGDKVQVITGKDKGKTGKIMEISAKRNRVKVEKINLKTKHIKKRYNQPGEKITFEGFMDASNVMVLDPKSNKPTRVKYNKLANGKKERLTVKSGSSLENSVSATKKVKA
ncbi:50S ribosomal protein L24 [Candidatus Peregrinibacteria bacterium]|nr:50S ribosomal protein L24 [Candidatus Peregrinibacteria bacterium]